MKTCKIFSLSIAVCLLLFLAAAQSNAQTVNPPSGKAIKIYILKEPGKISEVVLTGEDVRYEKRNPHSGKPDVLTVLVNVNNGSWSEYKVVAEFHADDIVGWAEVSHLKEK